MKIFYIRNYGKGSGTEYVGDYAYRRKADAEEALRKAGFNGGENDVWESDKMLKENCTANGCDSCCFCADDGLCCIARCCPENWKVPKPRRWSEGDVLMAKALKTTGWEKVRYEQFGVLFRTCALQGSGANEVITDLPLHFFDSLATDETVLLDDIIKEEECDS